jgi:hypothetical protein
VLSRRQGSRSTTRFAWLQVELPVYVDMHWWRWQNGPQQGVLLRDKKAGMPPGTATMEYIEGSQLLTPGFGAGWDGFKNWGKGLFGQRIVRGR